MAAKLNDAVKKSDIHLVQQLLEEGADINAKVENGWTPLHSAVQNDFEEIVNLLLENGADPLARKDNGATPFILAGVTGSVKLLKLFRDKGSDINECDINGFTAFMEAAWYGQEESLRFLYQNGADVNQRREVDENKKAVKKGGATALMDAASHGHFALVKALVEEMGANVNICDNKDANALIHALSEEKGWNKGREDSALFLLKNNIDANKRDVNGKTVLILAVERESLDLVKAILELDEVDLDDADENSETALKVAVEKKNKAVVELLCEKGARVENDVLNIARNSYQKDLIKYLQKYESPDSPRQPETCKEFSSIRWKSKLQKLNRMDRPMIGKLKIFQYQDLWIQKTTQGGVYLGFYAGEEVAVKIFCKGSENAKREKACFEKCRTSKFLVRFCGWEERKACLYLCLSLCEKNLQEYFKEEKSTTTESKDILKEIFQAVKDLHAFGFGHQELHPSNILIVSENKTAPLTLCEIELVRSLLVGMFPSVQEYFSHPFCTHQNLDPQNKIEGPGEKDKLKLYCVSRTDPWINLWLEDVTGNIFLADFDKSREIADDTKYSVISEDLQGLQKLILYIVMRGQLDFERLPTECPETVKEHKEIEDLRSKLELSDQSNLADSLLEMLIYHPYFWSKETKYRVLSDIWNKIRAALHDKMNKSDILNALKCTNDPFMDWKKKIDEKVLESMVCLNKEKGNKKGNKDKRSYRPGVIDLLRLIRNMGEHFHDKDDDD